jgi:hypothetical protein
MYLLQTNLAHVFDHLPGGRLFSHTAGKTGTDFIAELLELRHGIGLFCCSANHIDSKSHLRSRGGRRRSLTQGKATEKKPHKRSLGHRFHT